MIPSAYRHRSRHAGAGRLCIAPRRARGGQSAADQTEARLAAAHARTSDAQARIADLRLQIDKLKRQLFGMRSERTQQLLDQFELQQEEWEVNGSKDEIAAEQAAAKTATVASFVRKRPSRQPLPAYLPRERVVEPAPCACPACGALAC